MNKKLICSAVAMSMLLGLAPVTAFAEDTPNTLDTNIMDFRKQDKDASGDGWYWDANGQTLTLEDFQYSVPKGKLEEKAAIYLPEDSYVRVKGKNNVLETNSYHCDAFYCEGDVNFYGSGHLEISTTSGASAIYVVEGPLTIDDELEITVESKGYIIYLKHAKGDKPLISIQDDAKLIFHAKDHEHQNILITKKSGVKTSSNWLDFEQKKYDKDREYIELLAVDAMIEKDEQEIAKEKAAEEALNEYKIIIGNADIMKNGKLSYTADVVPYLNKDGYTMLPLRALLEVSNPEQKVNWSSNTKSAHTFVNNKLVTIRPDETTYTKELDTFSLLTPAETVNGRLFVSLRDWMSIMEIDVSQMDWNPATKTVTMKY